MSHEIRDADEWDQSGWTELTLDTELTTEQARVTSTRSRAPGRFRCLTIINDILDFLENRSGASSNSNLIEFSAFAIASATR